MNQVIVAYHKDCEEHWVAELRCGHFQHVRHNPPWANRLWVTSPEGRKKMLGYSLNCKKCDSGVAKDTLRSEMSSTGSSEGSATSSL